jgi:putative transposase
MVPVMTMKYKNRYRSESARAAAWWSYGWAVAYFITICTADREHLFGHIAGGTMVLSPVGEIAEQFWYEIPGHANAVKLGAFQVMPNHIHGIVLLGNRGDGGNETDTGTVPPARQRFRNQGKNTISSIVGGYKSAVTRHARRAGFVFGWQGRFHDHIIRNNDEYQQINDYIETNPLRWAEDRF